MNHSKTKLNPRTVAMPSAIRTPNRRERLAQVRVKIERSGSRAHSHHQTNRSNASEHERVRCELVIDLVRPQKPAGYSRWLRSGQLPPVFYIRSGAITPRRPSPVRSTFLVAAHKASLRRLKSSSSTST